MLIHLTYSEIRQYVREHFQQEIGIRFVNRQTISLSYSLNRFVPDMNVFLKIESINPEYLILSYSSKKSVSLIIRGTLMFMNKKINKDILDIMPDKKLIRVQLGHIQSVQEAFKHLTPENLFFSEDGVFLILELISN